MRLAPRIALLALLGGSAFAGEVQVRPKGELLEVVATAAPLQDVLARLSQHTGMKVVYDGTAPRNLVTATLSERTPVEAVLALFEGLGINYALKTDAGGTKVDTLIVTGAAASAPSRGAAAPPPATPASESRRPAPQPPGRPQPAVEPDEAEEREEAPEPDENAARPQPEKAAQPPAVFNGVIPGPGRPGSPFGSGQIGPLTLPTPPAMAPQPGATQPGATPAPLPTPSPTTNR